MRMVRKHACTCVRTGAFASVQRCTHSCGTDEPRERDRRHTRAHVHACARASVGRVGRTRTRMHACARVCAGVRGRRLACVHAEGNARTRILSAWECGRACVHTRARPTCARMEAGTRVHTCARRPRIAFQRTRTRACRRARVCLHSRRCACTTILGDSSIRAGVHTVAHACTRVHARPPSLPCLCATAFARVSCSCTLAEREREEGGREKGRGGERGGVTGVG